MDSPTPVRNRTVILENLNQQTKSDIKSVAGRHVPPKFSLGVPGSIVSNVTEMDSSHGSIPNSVLSASTPRTPTSGNLQSHEPRVKANTFRSWSKLKYTYDPRSSPFDIPSQDSDLTPQSTVPDSDEEYGVLDDVFENHLEELVLAQLNSLPFLLHYEIVRATHKSALNKSVEELGLDLSSDSCELWERLKYLITEIKNYEPLGPPVRTSLKDTWRNTASMSGTLSLDYAGSSFNPQTEFEVVFKLHPPTLGRSNRFFRKFGSDRFIYFNLEEVPEKTETPTKMQKSRFKRYFIKWLSSLPTLKILGRNWRPFHFKETKSGQVRVVFFAESGYGIEFSRNAEKFETSVSPVMKVEELLHWLIPLERERKSTVAKISSRLELGFSATIPTIIFKKSEIRKVDDMVSHTSGEAVMDDGCAVASPEVFRRIAEHLSLDVMPSAVQGRIGGAKGVWFIDPNSNIDSREVWINVTRSQCKYNWHKEDRDSSSSKDPARLTLDVLSVSKPPKEARMNIQLIPILEYCGVPFNALRVVILEYVQKELSNLESALTDPLRLRYWLEFNAKSLFMDQNTVNSDGDSIAFTGGFPSKTYDRLVMLLDAGFSFDSCSVMSHLLDEVLDAYYRKATEKFHFKLSMSTTLMCIADPTGSLEEGEVWLSFSEGLLNETKKQLEQHISGSILVARNPALMPSDIQKVTAVSLSEKYKILENLKDVIVFSTKGNRSLASLLSGGDYDGDKCWICWDPRIVEPFRNKPALQFPFEKTEFFEDCNLGLREVLNCGKNPLQIFFERGLTQLFTNKGQLGLATDLLSKYIYDTGQMDDEHAFKLSQICCQLVDAPKQGLTIRSEGLTKYNRQFKAVRLRYKDISNERPEPPAGGWKNICDRLRFDVAVPALEKSSTHIRDITRSRSNSAESGSPSKFSSAKDPDLIRLCKHFEQHEDANCQTSALYWVMQKVNDDVQALKRRWTEDVAISMRDSRKSDDLRRTPAKRTRKTGPTFGEIAESCRSQFLAIEPAELEHGKVTRGHELRDYWASPFGKYPWTQLKASVVYASSAENKHFAWWICGRELCEMKAQATEMRCVRTDVFEALRVNRKKIGSIILDNIAGREDTCDMDD